MRQTEITVARSQGGIKAWLPIYGGNARVDGLAGNYKQRAGALTPCNDALEDFQRRFPGGGAGLKIADDDWQRWQTDKQALIGEIRDDIMAGTITIKAGWASFEPHWVYDIDYDAFGERYNISNPHAAWEDAFWSLFDWDDLARGSYGPLYRHYGDDAEDLPPRDADITHRVIEHITVKRAQQAAAEQAEAGRKADLQRQAIQTGEAVVLSSRMTSCHSNEVDCSFDWAERLLHPDGSETTRYTHCY